MDAKGPPTVQWIVRGELMDEGFRTAAYPYGKFCPIRRPEDCRPAAIEESSTFEREFGNELVAPFYKLL
jgi:hypothetical protein